jgi:four helix bundle protein
LKGVAGWSLGHVFGEGEVNDAELAQRTKAFALRVLKLVASLPSTREADVLGRQLLRSGTSVRANYREARRGRSKADFAAKIRICLAGIR